MKTKLRELDSAVNVPVPTLRTVRAKRSSGSPDAFSAKLRVLPKRSLCRGAQTSICGCRPQTRRIPGAVIFGSSTPNPCTPSTISSTRSFSSRPRFASAMLSAIRAIGRRTPLLECTHVTPTARVFGRSPCECVVRFRLPKSSCRNRKAESCARSLRNAR